jgi:hypothetical protein
MTIWSIANNACSRSWPREAQALASAQPRPTRSRRDHVARRSVFLSRLPLPPGGAPPAPQPHPSARFVTAARGGAGWPGAEGDRGADARLRPGDATNSGCQAWARRGGRMSPTRIAGRAFRRFRGARELLGRLGQVGVLRTRDGADARRDHPERTASRISRTFRARVPGVKGF